MNLPLTDLFIVPLKVLSQRGGAPYYGMRVLRLVLLASPPLPAQPIGFLESLPRCCLTLYITLCFYLNYYLSECIKWTPPLLMGLLPIK